MRALARALAGSFGAALAELQGVTSLFLPATDPLLVPLPVSASFVGSGLFPGDYNTTVWSDATLGSVQEFNKRWPTRRPPELGRRGREAAAAALLLRSRAAAAGQLPGSLGQDGQFSHARRRGGAGSDAGRGYGDGSPPTGSGGAQPRRNDTEGAAEQEAKRRADASASSSLQQHGFWLTFRRRGLEEQYRDWQGRHLAKVRADLSPGASC